MGDAAAFSFYPGKNLGACGEAGAVTTSDSAIADRIRMLRDHGQSRKYFHDIDGYNGRIDAIQAGFLRAKLTYLAGWNEARRARAATYNRLLGDHGGVTVPSEPAWSRAVYHLYVVRVPNRDAAIQSLAARGIGTGIHYPVPVHLQKACALLGYRQGDFPVTERAAAEVPVAADVSNALGGTAGARGEPAAGDIQSRLMSARASSERAWGAERGHGAPASARLALTAFGEVSP